MNLKSAPTLFTKAPTDYPYEISNEIIYTLVAQRAAKLTAIKVRDQRGIGCQSGFHCKSGMHMHRAGFIHTSNFDSP